jgi:SNF2 family DNA or RNA helicase
MTLAEFVEKHHKRLVERLNKDLRPLYEPTNIADGNKSEKLQTLLRTPFPVQGEVIKGLSMAMFDKERTKAFICGEMGTGKTTIANAVAYLAPRPLRTLVVSPPHLTEKWKREIEHTVPGAIVRDITGRDVIAKLSLLKGAGKPFTHDFWIISKERAKLSYKWRPAYMINERRSPWPLCPTCFNPCIDKDDEPLTEMQLARKRHFCNNCGGALWQADNVFRRFSPAEYIKKYLKNVFDLVILDEIHEYKAGDSLQGQAMGRLVSCSKYFMGLTGTLNGGYADDIFYLLFRLDPQTMKSFGYEGVEKWQRQYGVLEEIETVKNDEDHRFGRGRKKSVVIKKKPGVSPEVIGRYFLDKTVFLRLSDVVDSLPSYDEYVVTVPMEEEQKNEYLMLQAKMSAAIREYKKKAAAAMLQSLLSYPDSCVVFPEEVNIKDRVGNVACTITAPQIDGSELLPKEKELITILSSEHREGRKSLVYLTFTGTRDIRGRVKKICEEARLRAGILPESVEPKKREAWINDNADKYDVLIANPELVKVGLDLVQFPTIVFFEVGYNISTLRQAARRSWRIGQTQPVKVYYLCYSGTMQETALVLTAKKMEIALLVEGDMPEGLGQYASTGGSMIEELTNALVEEKTYSGAEQIWAQMRKKEIEASLGMDATECSITTKGSSHAATATISEDVLINVSVASRGKKKMSRLSIRLGDIESELKGKVVQLELF